MAYQPLSNGKEVGLLEAVKARAEQKRQAPAIHAYRLLQRYGKPIHNCSQAKEFQLTHYWQCSSGNPRQFSHQLKWQRRSAQIDVMNIDDIQVVLVSGIPAFCNWDQP